VSATAKGCNDSGICAFEGPPWTCISQSEFKSLVLVETGTRAGLPSEVRRHRCGGLIVRVFHPDGSSCPVTVEPRFCVDCAADVSFACPHLAPSRGPDGRTRCTACSLKQFREARKRLEAIRALSDEELGARLDAADALAASLSEILDYRGGADSALEDEHVMDRARAAIAKATGGAK